MCAIISCSLYLRMISYNIFNTSLNNHITRGMDQTAIFLAPRFLCAANICCSCRWHIAGWKTHWYSWVKECTRVLPLIWFLSCLGRGHQQCPRRMYPSLPLIKILITLRCVTKFLAQSLYLLFFLYFFPFSFILSVIYFHSMYHFIYGCLFLYN